MTLQELVERLMSNPAYQAGRAADVEIHVDNGLFPLATRRVTDTVWVEHEGTEFIVLRLGRTQAGPMTGEQFGRAVLAVPAAPLDLRRHADS